MFQHALSEQPLECCGLLAGKLPQIDPDGTAGDDLAVAVHRYPLVNAKASPTEFESDPRSMFEAIRHMSDNDWELLAIYHSHPTAEPVPSKTDLARNYSSDVVNLIISLLHTPPTIQGWWLYDDHYVKADWLRGDAPDDANAKTPRSSAEPNRHSNGESF